MSDWKPRLKQWKQTVKQSSLAERLSYSKSIKTMFWNRYSTTFKSTSLNAPKIPYDDFTKFTKKKIKKIIFLFLK